MRFYDTKTINLFDTRVVLVFFGLLEDLKIVDTEFIYSYNTDNDSADHVSLKL